MEIERKFLVDPSGVPDVWPVEFEASFITQTGLVPRKKRFSSERVRKRQYAGIPAVYTHTSKIRIGDGIHEEDERVIRRSDYERLLKRADPAMVCLSKVRRVFNFEGQTFELDLFQGPFQGLVLLEIELTSMDVPVTLPSFLAVVREVTSVPGYTNSALAKKGQWP